MRKREDAYNPSLSRYQIVSYTLAAGASQQIDIGGAFFLYHFKSTDTGGAAGLTGRLGDVGEELRFIQGDCYRSGVGFDKIFLRNPTGATISGSIMVSHDPGFFFMNFFNTIAR